MTSDVPDLMVDGEVHNPMDGSNQPLVAALVEETSDIRAIKMVVSITLGLTLILAAGYLAAVVLSDGAILLRPSEVALERHLSLIHI